MDLIFLGFGCFVAGIVAGGCVMSLLSDSRTIKLISQKNAEIERLTKELAEAKRREATPKTPSPRRKRA